MSEEVTNLQLELGVLNDPQASGQMPVKPDLQSLVWARQAARGNVETVMRGDPPARYVTVDALRSLLADGSALRAIRQAHGLPPETILPLFTVAGNEFDTRIWNGIVGSFLGEIVKLIEAELPVDFNQMLEALQRRDMRWGRAAISSGDTNFPAVLTPEILAAIRKPIYTEPLFPVPGTVFFLNRAEVYLTLRLQELAFTTMRERSMAAIYRSTTVAQSASDVETGLRMLYRSAADYSEITNLAIERLQQTQGGAFSYIWLPGLDPLWDPKARRFTMLISDSVLMEAAGTNAARLACLAF